MFPWDFRPVCLKLPYVTGSSPSAGRCGRGRAAASRLKGRDNAAGARVRAERGREHVLVRAGGGPGDASGEGVDDVPAPPGCAVVTFGVDRAPLLSVMLTDAVAAPPGLFQYAPPMIRSPPWPSGAAQEAVCISSPDPVPSWSSHA